MPIEFRILGPLEISADGRLLPLGSPKLRALLGLLLVHANETLSRDRLIDELWAEAPPETVGSAVHVYLSRLRRLLESAGAGSALLRDGHGYRLRVETGQLDAQRFERLSGEGSEALAAGQADAAAERLRQALALWRGPALADIQSERFAVTVAGRLDEQRISVLEQRLEADLALGRHRQLTGELETLVQEHPFRERLRAQLMLALYRCGRQAEALRVYQEARRALADELGLEPGHELKQLERAILHQDDVLTIGTSRMLETGLESPLASSGAAAAQRDERKVVTVLCADLVAFAAQAEQLDPEDVRTIQERYWVPIRAEIERFGGTVDKFVGDTVIALFGAARAHEDDAERAVRAALSIRDRAREERLEVRIAITTGEALVRLGAEPLDGEGTATGQVINAAARLEAAAPTNGILVGERTFRATTHVIDYRAGEPVQAKGRADPIPVWEALRARLRFGAERLYYTRTPLLGRGRELDLLRSTLARVHEEQVPQLVTLVGVPGIGKTRLVYELMETTGLDPSVIISWCRGRSLPHADGVSFWALAEIVKAQAGVLESDSAEEAEQRLAHTVQTVLGESGEAEWVKRHLRPLAGLTAEGEVATESHVEAFAAWRRFFEALAERHPLVLVFEDMQWADDGLLDFVEGLVEWVSDVPLLIVTTGRPELFERQPGWAGGKPNAFTLSLAPLSNEETARLLDALGQSSLRPETQSTLLANVGGNPLYAEQYARALSERGEARELPVPETVQAVIAARLDALPTSEKNLLQDAAVFGQVFWSGATARLQGIERYAAEAGLRALERKEFIQRVRRSSVADESEYAFRHVLLRDVAYGQLPRPARSAKHQQAAAWIESLGRAVDHAEILAHHSLSAFDLERALGRSTDVLADRARIFARRAGDRARALNALAAAARFYERALELWPADDREQPRVLFALAEALHRSGDERRSERLEAARTALLDAHDHEGAAEAEAMLADATWYDGRHDRAQLHVKRALALIRERPPSPAKARILGAVARYHLVAGEYERALDYGREALAAAEAHELAELRAQALITVGTARGFTGDAADGAADVEAGLAAALTSNALAAASRAYNNLAALSGRQGDFDRAREHNEQAIRVAERLGDRPLLRYAKANLIHHQWDVGEWDEALAAADVFIGECERGNMHVQEHLVRETRAAIRHARGDARGAVKDAQRALELARQDKDPQTLAQTLGFCVRLSVELGRSDEAKKLAAEFLAQDPPRRSSQFALIAAQIGQLDEARAGLAGILHENVWDTVRRAIVDGDLSRAAEISTRSGSLALAADLRLRAAATLRGEGEHNAADEQLQKALAFYRSVGATRRIGEAEALLVAA